MNFDAAVRVISSGFFVLIVAFGIFTFLARPVRERSFEDITREGQPVQYGETVEQVGQIPQKQQQQTAPVDEQQGAIAGLSAYGDAVDSFLPLPSDDLVEIPELQQSPSVTQHESEEKSAAVLQASPAEIEQLDIALPKPEETELLTAEAQAPFQHNDPVLPEQEPVIIHPEPKEVIAGVNKKPGEPLQGSPDTPKDEWVSDIDQIIKEIEAEMAMEPSPKSGKTDIEPSSQPVIPSQIKQPPRVQAISVTGMMDEKDTFLLNKYFETSRSNFYYPWGNSLSGYTYEVMLQPAWTNAEGLICKTGTIKAWKEPQSLETVYYRQDISGCRVAWAQWYVQ